MSTVAGRITGGAEFVPPSAARSADALRRRAQLRNYVAFAIDGGAFMGAMSFVNGSTLLPVIIASLGGPTWLIALMPVMMLVGMQVPPLLTAHWIDRLRWYKPALLASGVGQRLPYLAAGLALLLVDDWPALVIAAVALAPLISGLSGGFTVTAFYQLLIKQIPQHRRSSVFASRFLISSCVGIVAGGVIATVLARFPGTSGYGILHLLAFVMMVVSWIVFAMIRETPTPTDQLAEHDDGLLDNLRAVPELLRADLRFGLYLGMRFFRNAGGILAAFLAIHAVNVLDASGQFVGQLVMVQAIGAIVGNLMAGYLGDRAGSRLTTIAGTTLHVVLCLSSIWAQSAWAFTAIFGLFGVATAMAEVGIQALGLEVCPSERRSTLLAVMSMVNLAGALLAAGLATLVRQSSGSFASIAVVTAAGMGVSLACAMHAGSARRIATVAQGGG